MQLKNILESQSVKDFSSLFFSNIFEKVLGLIRELIIAFFLGSSILYANFLLLRIVADFFSQFTAGNALKANLLPKFTKLYQKHKQLSLSNLFLFSEKISIYLFVITQIIQTSVIFYLDLHKDILFFFISIILSLSISCNFISFLFLTVFQAKGQFYKFSWASIFNSSIFTVLAFPLISFFSVLGLALSRLFGVLLMIWKFIFPIRKEVYGEKLTISISDFNFATLILGNFANIVLISSRFISGADGSNSITHFMYAVVILNTLLTSVIGNLTTITLRKFSIKKNAKVMKESLVISMLLGLSMISIFHFLSYPIVETIFLRGAFTISDVIYTSDYLSRLSYSFVFLFIASALFQPFLSLSIEQTRKERFYLALFFILSIIISSFFVLFMEISTIDRTVIVMTFTSLVSVLLAGYSYSKYLRYAI